VALPIRACGTTRVESKGPGAAHQCPYKAPLYQLGKEMKIVGGSPQPRKANVAPAFKKGPKDNLRADRLVSLTFLPGKIME